MASKLSYACGPSTHAHIYQSIPDRLRVLAEENPARDAFVFYNEAMERAPISRQELYERSRSLAKVLVGLGLKKGQTVGLCMNNSMETLISIMAVITAGGIPFFVATNLRDGSDIVETMTDMEASLLFIDTNQDNWKIIQRFCTLETHAPFTIPSLKYVICNGEHVTDGRSILSLATLVSSGSNQDFELPALDPEEVALYFCTSGSTGKPKIVTCNHFNLLNWTLMSNVAMQIKPDGVFFCDRQFGWVVGFPRNYLACGTTRVFIDTKVSLSGDKISDLCDIIQNEKCDAVYLPGYLATDLMKNPELSDRFSNVNSLFCSGERVPRTASMLKDSFCKTLYYYYGNTECGGATAFSSSNAEDYEDGLIGRPISGVEVKIIDDEGRTVESGISGELCIRTPFRFMEYKNDPEKTAEVLDNKNWFHTGDIAHMRLDSNLVVEGRIKELISMQTVKYFPWDVEKVLKNCPGAKFTIAVGVPDERLTNVICACVVPDETSTLTANDVKSFCEQMFLEETTASRLSLKPKYYVMLEKLPLTNSGKIDRRRIAEIARERLSL